MAMKSQYFVNVTDAGEMAGLGLTNMERIEKELAKLGVMPAGRIKSSWKGKSIYKPFYDPDEIMSADFGKAAREEKLKKLNQTLEKAEKLKREIATLGG